MNFRGSFPFLRKEEKLVFDKLPEREFFPFLQKAKNGKVDVEMKYTTVFDFYTSRDSSVVYMTGNINRSVVSLSGLEEAQEYVGNLVQRAFSGHMTFSYSETQEGTEIMTGNLYLGAPRMIIEERAQKTPISLIGKDKLFRITKPKGINDIVTDHVNYVRGMSLVKDSNLVDKLIDAYKSLDIDLGKLKSTK